MLLALAEAAVPERRDYCPVVMAEMEITVVVAAVARQVEETVAPEVLVAAAVLDGRAT
jgi:hypothetical protein